ncbi:MAG: cysteine--tRNA ligase [Patescibacteria group bacterium]|nr:cysteine--tRNA ligase [Patescibacteria group bacterium]
MKFYNTLTRQKELFKPIKKGRVSMYNCGPTVYWHMQIGNLRAYAFVDVLRRAFEYLGYEVDQVMNLTDVGHLTSDADTGDDKLEKTARKQKKDIWDIAAFYIDSVEKDFKDMNFLTPKIWVRATDHIDDMIKLNQMIEKNGYTYGTERALYFDVTKYADYTRLQGGQDLDDKRVGVRDNVNVDPDKKHPADFALWVRCVGSHKNHVMRWESPWGVGFPGWHIECSAMGIKYLGDHFDIHTGGEDHISTHHPNERAQNYGAYQKEVVNMWLHNAFLLVDGGKMGKSLGNAYGLSDVVEKGFDPMDLRYFYISANYRTKQNFTWGNLESAQTARKGLVSQLKKLLGRFAGVSGFEDGASYNTDDGISYNAQTGGARSKHPGKILQNWKKKFVNALEDDLNMPEGLAVVWQLLKSKEESVDKVATILDFDKVLGLRLPDSVGSDKSVKKLTSKGIKKVEKLIVEREKARVEKDWTRADEIREEIENMGVQLEDTKEGSVWTIE